VLPRLRSPSLQAPPPFGGTLLSGRDRSVGRDLDAALDKTLANQILEGRPGPAARLEHAVHLPLGQETGIAPPSLRPVCKPGQTAEPTGHLDALLDGQLESFFADRDFESGPSKRLRQRSEGVPVKRLRRYEAAVIVDVLRRRYATEPLA